MDPQRPLSLEPREAIEARSPRASVVIPNYNGMSHLPECLSTLWSQSFTDFEVIMVDNASEDDSVEYVRREHPRVRIVRRSANGGPTKALDDGILASRGEYIVLTNNDIAADREWLGSLVRALDEHPQYDSGVSMVLLYYHDGFLQSAGETYSVLKLTNIGRGFEQPYWKFLTMERVLATLGVAAIHRRSVFVEVGLIDENLYHGFHSEVDFALRCLIRGKRCLYVPDSRIRHKIGLGRGVTKSSDAERFHETTSMAVAAKNLPLPLLAVGLAATAWREFRRTLPVRPSYWHLIPGLVREQPLRMSARAEGFRIGWSQRRDLWRSRTASRREVYRWVLRGYGRV